MTDAAKFFVGWCLAVSGFGSCAITLLFYARWYLMTFSCRLPEGGSRRVSGTEIQSLVGVNNDRYLELFDLNPGLEEWFMMTPQFPPFWLRRIVLRRVTIRVPWLSHGGLQ